MDGRSILHVLLLLPWIHGITGLVAANDALLTASSVTTNDGLVATAETSFKLNPESVTDSAGQSTAKTKDSQQQYSHNSTDKPARSSACTTESQDVFNKTDSENNDTTVEKTCGVAEDGKDKVYYLEAHVAVLVDQYGGVATLMLGTVGNVLVLVTLNTGHLAKKSSFLFLSVMAGSDLAFIVLGQGGRHFVRSISGVDLLALSRVYCRVWYVLVPALSMYADWVLAGLSAERAIAVASPLKAMSYITSWRSRTYLLIMLLVCGGYYTYSIFYYDILQLPAPGGTIRPVCTLSQVDIFTDTIRPWLEFTINCILPATIIVISNGVVIYTLVKARSQRNHIASSLELAASNDDQTRGVTSMLLAASIAFIFLTMPVRVGFVMDRVFPSEYWATDQKQAQRRLMWAINIFCLYLSHAINFMLYVLTGPNFRLALTKLLCCWCRCPSQPKVSRTPSSPLAVVVSNSGSQISASAITVSSAIDNPAFESGSDIIPNPGLV